MGELFLVEVVERIGCRGKIVGRIGRGLGRPSSEVSSKGCGRAARASAAEVVGSIDVLRACGG